MNNDKKKLGVTLYHLKDKFAYGSTNGSEMSEFKFDEIQIATLFDYLRNGVFEGMFTFVKPEDFNKTSEKFIVSTVDDFQGDERDIIILSTVRNPQEPSKSNPGFILAYQRINVALSRARRLLIVVGNRKYLEQRGVINYF